MITKIWRSALAAALVGAAVLVSVPAGRAHAAPSTGNQKLRKEFALIFGTVWDAKDRPVYGVKIKIRRADEKKPRWELVSNHTGEFAQRVPAEKADYIVVADVKTPKGKPQPQTSVHVEFDERVDIGLHLTE